MRSILEKAIVALLNEEHDQAEALFHKFMVERARQIHESLRQGEDAILENFDEDITSEQYFTEEDLDDVEDTAADDVAGDEAGDEVEGDDVDGADFGGEDEAADVDAEGDDLGDADFDMGGDDLEGDVGGEEGDLEAKVSDLEAQLEQLQAEFEELMGGEDMGGDDLGDEMGDDFGGDVAADDLGGDDLGGDDFGGADDFAADADADAVEDDMDAEDADAAVRESEEEEKEEDFEDISESIVSELEKISVSLSDGKEIGTGKTFAQNGKSPALQKKPNPMTDGKPITVKAEEHKGFEREEAPSVKDMKKRKNTRNKSTDGTAKVSKEGDKSAELNKLKAPDVKSPLAKR